MSCLNRSTSIPLKNDEHPPRELLDDLCCRFVLNAPKEDHESSERLMFLVEHAHWFYEDKLVEKNPNLKSFTLKEFTYVLFNNCDVLGPYVLHIDEIYKRFTSYKARIPVTGAIILDERYERCLLVKGWNRTIWSFPRGKKGKGEEDDACAIREVLEEIGFDISKLLNKTMYIEKVFGEKRVRLYIVSGVKDDTSFAAHTNKEISEIAWHRLDELQPAVDEVISQTYNGLMLYMVAPFLASLKQWISAHQPLVISKRGFICKELVPGRQKNIHRGASTTISVWKVKKTSSGNSSTMSGRQKKFNRGSSTTPDSRVAKLCFINNSHSPSYIPTIP